MGILIILAGIVGILCLWLYFALGLGNDLDEK